MCQRRSKRKKQNQNQLEPIIMAFISDNTTEEFLATVGNSSYNRHLTFTNETNVNPNTTIIHDLYPSGYSLTHIVFASIVVTLLMIIIVVGNMLVIIAIITEKSLKNIQNWFIASLAVADFFLGLVIMPFSLANELMGYWIFGPWWCDIHSGMSLSQNTTSFHLNCFVFYPIKILCHKNVNCSRSSSIFKTKKQFEFIAKCENTKQFSLGENILILNQF